MTIRIGQKLTSSPCDGSGQRKSQMAIKSG
nr:MAG TPA: hypothetical protein [Caudoviricetes sp.]